MAVNEVRTHRSALHPIHAVLLAGTIPLFLGGMLSDIAYSVSYEIQWNNFSSWLIAGGLVFGGFALLLAIIDLVRSDHRSAYSFVYPVLLIVAWVIGFLNSLVHAKDAWASMPTGLILSVIVFMLVGAATWAGFARWGIGGER